jgi:hypothetical protein
MTESQRPGNISASLKMIKAEFPSELADALEAYISHLETNQVAILPDAEQESKRPPIWSQQRVREREEHHRERAMKKLTNYR